MEDIPGMTKLDFQHQYSSLQCYRIHQKYAHLVFKKLDYYYYY